MEDLTEEQKEEVLALLADDDLTEEELIEKISALPYADAADEWLAALFMIPPEKSP